MQNNKKNLISYQNKKKNKLSKEKQMLKRLYWIKCTLPQKLLIIRMEHIWLNIKYQNNANVKLIFYSLNKENSFLYVDQSLFQVS